MESKKKAIYVHGLGSGAASTTIDIVRVIRETIGYGTKEYFVSRLDGIQEYILDESV